MKDRNMLPLQGFLWLYRIIDKSGQHCRNNYLPRAVKRLISSIAINCTWLEIIPRLTADFFQPALSVFFQLSINHINFGEDNYAFFPLFKHILFVIQCYFALRNLGISSFDDAKVTRSASKTPRVSRQNVSFHFCKIYSFVGPQTQHTSELF